MCRDPNQQDGDPERGIYIVLGALSGAREELERRARYIEAEVSAHAAIEYNWACRALERMEKMVRDRIAGESSQSSTATPSK